MYTVLSASTILTIILVIAFIWLFSLYVGLVRKKNTVMQAFASVDVQLKKRYDLIPNILTIANKFMEHEKDLFAQITELRTRAMKIPTGTNQINEKMEINNQLSALIGQLQVTAENYPQLKSDQTMLSAMKMYNSVEEHIAAARRYYNAAVKDLNNSVEIFPSSIVALMLNIQKAEFIKAQDFEKQTVDTKSYFS